MSGAIWRTPSGETGPETGRQSIGGVIVVQVLIQAPGHLTDWHSRTVHVPLRDLVEVPAHQTRYGGADGGRG